MENGTDVSSISSAPWIAARPMPHVASSWWRLNETGRWAMASRIRVESRSP